MRPLTMPRLAAETAAAGEEELMVGGIPEPELETEGDMPLA